MVIWYLQASFIKRQVQSLNEFTRYNASLQQYLKNNLFFNNKKRVQIFTP